MQPLVFQSKIVDGKTTCSQAIGKALKAFEGRWVSIAIKELKRGRSNSQNAFYHACVVPVIVELLREYGNDADCDIAHAFCKDMFLPPAGVKKVRVGKVTHESRSSTWLNTIEWEEYIERIRVFAAENNYTINYPNEF
jgi:hypothetical protein